MRLNGLGVSPGIGVGRALVVTRGSGNLRFRIADRRVPLELERLDAARARSRTQLEHIKKRIATAAGADHAYLFDAQLLMLDDPMLVERAASLIRTDRLNAESALDRALDEVSALFDRGDDPYLRERKGDVADVVGRLCMNLQPNGDPGDLFRDIDGPLVLVADELSPSLIAQMDWQRLAALVTDAGSWTYHTAILARSLHVPAVAGLRHASKLIPPGALLAVDGSSGDVTLEPSPDLLEELDVRSTQAARVRSSRSRNTAGCRRSCRTARPSGSKQTSNCRRRPSARGNAAPKGSACIDRSSSWRGRARPGSTKTRSTPMYVRSDRCDARAPRHRAHVRRHGRAARSRRLGRRGTRAARPSRTAAQPLVRRYLSGAAARTAARRHPWAAPHHVSVRHWSGGASRRARRDRSGPGHAAEARASTRRSCRWAS